jgi:hypothetical protein
MTSINTYSMPFKSNSLATLTDRQANSDNPQKWLGTTLFGAGALTAGGAAIHTVRQNDEISHLKAQVRERRKTPPTRYAADYIDYKPDPEHLLKFARSSRNKAVLAVVGGLALAGTGLVVYSQSNK